MTLETVEQAAYAFAATAFIAFIAVCVWLAVEHKRQEPPPP